MTPHDDRTRFDPSPSDSTPAAPQSEPADDFTVVDPQSGNTDTAGDADSADDHTLMDSASTGESDAAGGDDVDRTLMDDGNDGGSRSQSAGDPTPADNDQPTLIDAPAGQADVTRVDDGGQADIDATFIDSPTPQVESSGNSDEDRTIVDPSAGPSSADDDDLDATFLDEGNQSGPDADATFLDPESAGQSGHSAGADDGPTLIDSGASDPGFDQATEADFRTPGQPAASGSQTGSAERKYDLIDDFAKGGLGKIWRARDIRIRRDVAYKELLPKALANPVVVERFLEEAQITGQLEHPGIVPIYDLGYQDNGTPFYAMKLVHGKTLKDAIIACHELEPGSPQRHLAFVKLLRNFIDVCNAIGFAHERGVLHRDLKPLNIMLGDFGETLVLDWGLAKLIGDAHGPHDAVTGAPATDSSHAGKNDATAFDQTLVTHDGSPPESDDATIADPAAQAEALDQAAQADATGGHSHTSSRQTVSTDVRSKGSETMMGSLMGTPAYMPPEQALGKLDELDPRTDNYSLGAILYEILTQQTPVARGKLVQMVKDIVEGTVTPPRAIDPTIARPLDAICMKALSKRREDRYQTAIELAGDVEAWLADEPVSAWPEPWYHRLRRWVKQHRTLVSSTAATLAVMILGWISWGVVDAQRIAGIRRNAEDRIASASTALDGRQFARAALLLREAAGFVASEPVLEDLRSGIDGQLSMVETKRLESIRGAINEQLRRARLAADGRNYSACSQILNEAIGELSREPELAVLRETVEAELQDTEQERLDEVRGHLETKLAEASRAVETRQDYNEAKTLLAEALATLESEPELADIRIAARERLKIVDAAIAAHDAESAAQTRFADFQQEVDLARFYGSLFTGDNIEQDSREAQRHAQAALDLYRDDEGAIVARNPPHLNPDQLTTLREDSFEMLVVQAEIELKLSQREAADQQQAAAEKALQWLEQARELGIPSQSAHLYEAVAWHRLGRTEERNRAIAEAQNTKPTRTVDLFLLGEYERKQRNYEKALLRFQEALRISPDHFWSMQFMGLCNLQQLRPAAAVASYTACLASRPDFVGTYVVRAIAYGELGQFENALADFEKALELDPDFYGIYSNRGAVHLQMKQYAEAIADFRKAAEMRPDRADPLVNLGEAFRQQGDFQQSLATLTQAAEISPDTGNIYRIRGDVQLRLQAAEQALRDFERSAMLEQSPANVAYSYKQIGMIHHRAGDTAKALEAYDLSLDATADDPETVRLRAEALESLNRFDELIIACTAYLRMVGPEADVDRLRRISPQMLESYRRGIPDVYRLRGLARARLGRTREAMDDYTRALEYESSPNMLTRRGWAYLLKANTLALEDFEEAIRQNPENADSYNGRGYAKVMLGNYAGAVQDAEEAIKHAQPQIEKQGPQTWPLIYNAATIYAQAVDRVQKDSRREAEQQEQIAGQFTRRSIQLIVQAANLAGPQQQRLVLATLAQDSALDPIRNREEFRQTFGPKEKPTPGQEQKPDERPEEKPAPKPDEK